MADRKDKKKEKAPSRRMWMVDPIYRRFTAKAFQTLTSPEFFEFFNSMMKNGEQQFQFSNRKIKIDIDEEWVQIIENTLPAFIEISRNPRVIITQEELITNVVQAKKIDSQVVKHLCAHSNLVAAVDENGDVIPNKVLNIFKEETWDTYENRFVYTLIRKTYDFVSKRYQDMREAMNDEFGANLLIDATAGSRLEQLEVHSSMKIKQIDDFDEADPSKRSLMARVAYIYDSLNKILLMKFSKEMAKYSKVFPPLVSTNAIKKNPYLRKCHTLWDFFLRYNEAGFTVEIVEQNPEINKKFEQDIVDNIMFTYIILKGYLEDNRDRALDRTVKARRRELRPKYIKQIIEEVVRDFNLSEVEVRKILVEELTREDLMREERAERYRLAEEKRRLEADRKKAEEAEKLRQKKEKEKEARQRQREKVKEKARQERVKKKEAERLEKARELQAEKDARRLDIIEEELARQMEGIEKLQAKKYKRPLKKKKAPASKAAAAGKKTPAAKPAAAKAAPAPAPAAEQKTLQQMLEEERDASSFGSARSASEKQEAWRTIASRNGDRTGVRPEEKAAPAEEKKEDPVPPEPEAPPAPAAPPEPQESRDQPSPEPEKAAPPSAPADEKPAEKEEKARGFHLRDLFRRGGKK